MVGVGRDIKAHPVPPLAMGRDTFHNPSLLQAPSNMALDTSRDVATTDSLGNHCQGLASLTGKNFSHTFNLNLLSASLKPFPLSCHYNPMLFLFWEHGKLRVGSPVPQGRDSPAATPDVLMHYLFVLKQKDF